MGTDGERLGKRSITKIRENCNAQFETHWQCLEKNNQVGSFLLHTPPLLGERPKQIANFRLFRSQYYQACRTQEGALNRCLADKLVRRIDILSRLAIETLADLSKPLCVPLYRA